MTHLNEANRYIHSLALISETWNIHVQGGVSLCTFPETDGRVSSKKHVEQVLAIICNLKPEPQSHHCMPRGPKLLIHRLLYHLCCSLEELREQEWRESTCTQRKGGTEEGGRTIITNLITTCMLLAGSDAELHSLHSHFFIHVRELQIKELSHLHALAATHTIDQHIGMHIHTLIKG